MTGNPLITKYQYGYLLAGIGFNIKMIRAFIVAGKQGGLTGPSGSMGSSSGKKNSLYDCAGAEGLAGA
jgi:hypothetical protein